MKKRENVKPWPPNLSGAWSFEVHSRFVSAADPEFSRVAQLTALTLDVWQTLGVVHAVNDGERGVYVIEGRMVKL